MSLSSTLKAAFFCLLATACGAGAESFSSLAWENYLSGNLSKAAEYYLKQSEINPSDDIPLLNAAMCEKQKDNYDGAILLLQKAYALNPSNSDIPAEIGWLKFHLADYDSALPYFEKAIKLNPSNHRAYLGLSAVYAQLKDIVKTVENLKKYEGLRKDFAGVDYIYAWNYVNFQLYDQAREYLINALRKDPSFIEARLPLAGIYLREGKYNEAWNQYERVIDYAPGHPLAKEMLKKIRGKLTSQPEDIRPPFKIKNPTQTDYINALEELKKSPNIRVAIGANNKGEQWKNKSIKFRSFYELSVTGKKSGKRFATIPAGEIWELSWKDQAVSLVSPKGMVYGNFTGPIKIVPSDRKKGTFIIESDRNSSNPYFRYSDREYRGYLEAYPSENGISIVNVVPMEIYLLGVVPAEMEPLWPIEALKAQAILARTQAVIRAQSGPHKKQGYHICDTEHCQVYRGVNIENNNSNNAVVETEGEILTWHGRPAYSFYHSNSGGFIQASEEVTGWGRVPYLVSKADFLRGDFLNPWEFNLWIKDNPPSYSNYPGVVKNSEYRWMKIIKKKDLEYKLNKDYGIGELIDVIPLRRSKAGNVNSIRVVGSRRTLDINKEHLIRNAFGFSSLKSTLFLLEINRFKNRKIRNFWFYGGGWGHGIGMSQSGAAGMAGKYGSNFREILDFYFPGTKIKKLKYIKKKN